MNEFEVAIPTTKAAIRGSDPAAEARFTTSGTKSTVAPTFEMTRVNPVERTAITVRRTISGHGSAEGPEHLVCDPCGCAGLFRGYAQWDQSRQQEDRSPVHRLIRLVDAEDPEDDHPQRTSHEAYGELNVEEDHHRYGDAEPDAGQNRLFRLQLLDVYGSGEDEELFVPQGLQALPISLEENDVADAQTYVGHARHESSLLAQYGEGVHAKALGGIELTQGLPQRRGPGRHDRLDRSGILLREDLPEHLERALDPAVFFGGQALDVLLGAVQSDVRAVSDLLVAGWIQQRAIARLGYRYDVDEVSLPNLFDRYGISIMSEVLGRMDLSCRAELGMEWLRRAGVLLGGRGFRVRSRPRQNEGTENDEIGYAAEDEGDSDRCDVEEPERLQPERDEKIVEQDQGATADECERASEDGREAYGHEEEGNGDPESLADALDGGQEEGGSTNVLHEAGNPGDGHRYRDDNSRRRSAGDRQDGSDYPVDDTGPVEPGTDDDDGDDGDDGVAAEPNECLRRRDEPQKRKGYHHEYRHDIDADPFDDEKEDRHADHGDDHDHLGCQGLHTFTPSRRFDWSLNGVLLSELRGRSLYDFAEIIGLERLGYQVESPLRECFPGDLDGGVAGDDDNLGSARLRNALLQDAYPVDIFHADVRYDDVEGLLSESPEHVGAILVDLDPVSVLFQCELQALSDDGLVVR